MLVRRRTCGLHYEDIRTANVLADLKVEFTIREALGAGLSGIAAKMRTELLGESRMRITRENFDVARYAHELEVRVMPSAVIT